MWPFVKEVKSLKKGEKYNQEIKLNWYPLEQKRSNFDFLFKISVANT